MDWFERLTGFREKDHAQVQQMLEIDGELLRSKANGRAWRIGASNLYEVQSGTSSLPQYWPCDIHANHVGTGVLDFRSSG